MARPPRCRYVAGLPASGYFKPRGIPVSELEEVALTIDEMEAIRLADLECMYQEKAAEQMKISRQTFGRIVASARRKVADALVKGKALRIEGGNVETAPARDFVCRDCGHTWQEPFGTGHLRACPGCGGDDLLREREPRRAGRRRRARRG